MSRRFPSRPFPSREPALRRNGKIRAREVRVLDETKQPLGVMPLSDALRLAQTKGLDLIEIAPTATPPVCRIIEYGKFQYEEAKRKRDSAARQPSRQMKEVQLTPNIDPNDFKTKVSHAIEFLCNDQIVRVKLRFRGRQRTHKKFGFDVVNNFIRETAAYGRSDSVPSMAGDRDLHATINPLPRDQRAKNPREGQDPLVPGNSPAAPKPKPAVKKVVTPPPGAAGAGAGAGEGNVTGNGKGDVDADIDTDTDADPDIDVAAPTTAPSAAEVAAIAPAADSVASMVPPTPGVDVASKPPVEPSESAPGDDRKV